MLDEIISLLVTILPLRIWLVLFVAFALLVAGVVIWARWGS